MNKIKIDVSSDKKSILLSGDIDKITGNRYAMRYIKDYLKPEFNITNISVSVSEEGLENSISQIRLLLSKYGLDEERSESTQNVLADFYEEEEKFEKFSEEALNIRNNRCNHSDFEDFTNILKNNIPNRTLYDLQLLSAYHLAFSQNACNFSVPGAGKTSIVYGAYTYLKKLPEQNNKKIDKLLIIGPLSSFGPWELEYLECYGRYPKIQRLTSSMSKQSKIDYLYSSHTCELTLISYASLVTLKKDIIFFLKSNKVMVVLDEAHKFKNISGGIVASSVLEIAKYCKSRVVLTGTPAPNGYEDLFNMFKFIWPSKNVIGYQINQLRDMTLRKDEVRVDNLINAISPFFIRIKKSDLNIPNAKINPPIKVEMGNIQRKIYDFIESKYIESMIQNGEQNITSKFKQKLISAKMIRLMQAATNPGMLSNPLSFFLEDEEIPQDVYGLIDDENIMKDIMLYSNNETPAKFIATYSLVKSIIDSGQKVVIWATFIQTILDLKEYLKEMGIQSQELYGAIPVEKQGLEDINEEQIELTREKIVRDFQNEDCPYKVLIANPFAVGESISLHKACHNAIYIERTFNAAHFIQSKDRIHRYGLKKNDETNYYFIMSKDTIDETIDERLAEKERRMFEIMENMPIPLFDNVLDDLGDEDIKVLIKNYVKKTKTVL